MRGIQGPGGSRSRARSRRVYAVRRILTILALLLLLALLIPRACQAIFGPGEDVGSKGHRENEAPQKAAGTGVAGGKEHTTAKEAGVASGATTNKKGGVGSEEARKHKAPEGQHGGTTANLGEILTDTLASRVAGLEGTGSEQNVAGGGNGGAAQPASTVTKPAPAAQQPTTTGLQPAPVAQQASAAPGPGTSITAAPAEEPPPEPVSGPTESPVHERASGPAAAGSTPGRVPKLKPVPLPAELPAVQPASVPEPVAVSSPEPAPEPINVAPVPATTVPATPVPPTPVPPTPVPPTPVPPTPVPAAPVVNDAAFAAGAASVRANTGGIAGVPVNNAAALPGAGAGRGAPAMAKAAVPALP